MAVPGSNELVNTWRFGEYVLWPAQRRLLRAGELVQMEERPFDLLVLLATHWDRPLDRREVSAALWGRRPVSDNTLRQLVYKARRAVGDDGKRQSVIRTLHGRSLQWVAPLELVVEPAPAGTVPARGRDDAKRAASWRAGWRWVAVVVLGTLALLVPRAQAPQLGSLPRIAVEPITNATGDTSLAWVDNGLSALLASLLAQRGGVDVVDPLSVARAWKGAPQQGRNHAQQLRYATGADVVVGGRLSTLSAGIYALNVAVTRGNDEPTHFTLSGSEPSVLAVDAVAGIRRKLGLNTPRVPDRLPHDAFLAAAFARGEDFAAHGQWPQARDDFRVVANGAPEFLPAVLNLGIALARTNDLPGGESVLHTVLKRAARQGDLRTQAKALLYLGNLARAFDRNPQAQGFLVQAIGKSRQAGDVAAEIKARILLADVLHKLQQRAESHNELHSAKAMLAQHAELVAARSLLYTTENSIAGDEGDQTTALKAARAALAVYTSLGDQTNTVVSEFNVANTLRDLHRDAESLSMSAHCRKQAAADHMLGLEFICGANLAASLVNLGLPEAASGVARTLLPIALKLHNDEYQVLVWQLRALSDLERGDFGAALAALRKGAAVTDVRKLEYATYLDQEIYTAVALYEVSPDELAAMSRRFDVQAKGRLASEGYAQRRAMLRALAAAARRQPAEALTHLREAARSKPLAADGGFELRMPALLIAMADHDQAAAAIALHAYDPATAVDASVLPLYVRWANQIGDRQAAAHASTRLAALRKQGRDALAAAAKAIDPSLMTAVLTR